MAVAVGDVTRLLAAMQTSINAAGLRSFDGDIDRFAIFSLIVRETLARNASSRAISMHSLAISLSRSFETVRRHVLAMTEQGLCVRRQGGVMARADILERPDIAALMRLAHDAFVRLVEGLAALGDGNTVRRPAAATVAYRRDVGIAASIDVMLATADSNRTIHRNWLDLVLFSTVLAGNLHRFDARRGLGDDRLAPAHAIRASLIARVLNVSETTVRRRLATLTVSGGPLTRLREGFLLSEPWLTSPEAIETSRRTYETIRLIVAQAVAQGFPIDDPASAYCDGPPPVVSFA